MSSYMRYGVPHRADYQGMVGGSSRTISAVKVDPLARWKTAITTVGSAPVRVVMIGDSLTEGQGATTRADRWVDKLRDLLRAGYPSGAVGGGNYYPPYYNVYAADSTWATWRTAETGTITNDAWAGDLGWRHSTFAASATRTYTVVGTSVDIWWAANGGSFTYQIDGGTVSSAISTAGVYSTGNRTTVSLGSAGTHTIKLTCTVASFYFEGLTVYNGDETKGVQVYEAGRTSITSTTYAATPADFQGALAAVNPDLVIIELGLNDPGSAISTATTKANLLSLIATARLSAVNPSIVVMAAYNPVTTFVATATWQTYVTAMKEVAVAANTAFLDLSVLMPTATTAGTGFYRTDGLHPNDSGHTEIASRVVTFLAVSATTTYPLTGSIASTSSVDGSFNRIGPPVRFYLTSAAPDFTPSTVRGTWTDSSLTANAFALGRTKSGTNTALSATETNATNPTKVMISRHISAPLKGGQITGGTGETTLRLTQARLESDANMNATVQIAAWITVGNTDVVRDWVINPFAGATEFATTLTAFTFTLGASVTFEVHPGDRLVVELGYSAANAVTTSYTGGYNVGGTSADLATSGTTGVSTDSAWLEMSGTNADVVFAPYMAPTIGALTDQKFLDFTSTNALTSQYHVFAEGMSATTLGLLVELHGDGAFSFNNPDSAYALGGDVGIRRYAKDKGYLVVSALAPDTSGSVTWWEGGTANATYLRDLINKITADYPAVDRSQIWFSTFSGGSQLLTEYFLPMYSNTFFGGGAVIFGGGDEPLTTVVPFTTPFKTHFPMHWIAGQFDDGVTVPTSGFNGKAAAVAGKAYYDGQGFTGTTYDIIAGYNHDLPQLFGGLLNPYLPTVVPSTALAGGISSTSTVTGALRQSFPVTGSIASTSSVAGAVSISQALTGSAASTSTVTGAMRATQVLAGSISSTSSVVGSFISTQVLAGSIQSTSTVTGALRQTYPVSGSIASTSSVAGVLTATLILSGAVASTSTVAGAFAAGSNSLSGSVASVSTVTGSLIATQILAGSAASSSSVTGSLTARQILAGIISSTSSVAGTLRVTISIAGSIASSSTVSGVETMIGVLSGSMASVSTTAADFTGGSNLNGSIVSISTVIGTFTGRQVLAGSVVSTSTVVGALRTTYVMTGSISSASSVIGGLTTIQVVSGSIISTSSTTGIFTMRMPLSGSVASTSTVTGAAGIGAQSYPLAGSIISTSTVSGTVVAIRPLAGSISSVSTVIGAIVARGVLAGSIASTSMVTGAFVQRNALTGSIASTSLVLGDVAQRLSLAGSVISISSTTGVLKISSGVDLNVIIGNAEGTIFTLGLPEQPMIRLGFAEQRMFTVGGGIR